MSDGCEHRWGPAEECETPLGTFHSPVCEVCGAVKLEVDRNARQRFDIERLVPKPRPIATNQPPAGAPPVHPFQTEIFTDL